MWPRGAIPLSWNLLRIVVGLVTVVYSDKGRQFVKKIRVRPRGSGMFTFHLPLVRQAYSAPQVSRAIR